MDTQEILDVKSRTPSPHQDAFKAPSPTRRDALTLSKEERDRMIDSRPRSLEYAITSKPKPRPKDGDAVLPNKAALLVQKMWGNLSGAIRVRGDKRVTRTSV